MGTRLQTCTAGSIYVSKHQQTHQINRTVAKRRIWHNDYNATKPKADVFFSSFRKYRWNWFH